MNVSELLDDATARLRAAGVIKPRREANRLWAWLHRVSPGEAYLGRERGAETGQAAAYDEAVSRRIAGEPLAYVLGHTGFRTLELRCDARALIPRPETEGVIDLALARVRTGRALDLGTGSGCLALALAAEGQFDEVVAVDSSEPALELAAENAALTGLRIRLMRADFTVALALGSFDLVVSNPPYLSDAEYAALDASVRRWEPAAALVSGPDGLAAPRSVLRQGGELLKAGGWLVMELDFSRSGTVAELARQSGYTDVEVSQDLFGRPRYLAARRA